MSERYFGTAALPFQSAVYIEQGQSIEYEDAHNRFLEMMADPDAFGFTNVTETAWDEGTGVFVPNPEEYMFWDVFAHYSQYTRIANHDTQTC